MTSCIIIDDEPLAVDLLGDYVSRLPDIEVKNTFTNPISALTYLKDNQVDVLFLDIQMPELNGLDFIRIIGQEQAVVLTTAYGEYALESYEFRVFDFLLKPISFERFKKAVQKVNNYLDKRPDYPGELEEAYPTEKGPVDQKAKDLYGVPGIKDTTEYIFVKSGTQTLRIDLANIAYISGTGDYATIYQSEGGKVLTLENLSDLAGRLPERHFARIHRSHIVALGKIDFIERRRVAIHEDRLPISDTYAESFQKKLG
ncbi:MAG: LytTR family DNA-binding domain-containing protein [Bacteroidota bacterium]